MAQHDYDIANQAGAAFRADLNNALLAAASQNSGATVPSPTFAHMPWPDSANDIFKIRNAANTGWISLFTISTGAWLAVPTKTQGDNSTSPASTAYADAAKAAAISTASSDATSKANAAQAAAASDATSKADAAQAAAASDATSKANAAQAAAAQATATVYGIGSPILGRPADTTDYAAGAEIAGTSLYTCSSFNYRGSTAWSITLDPVLINTGNWRCTSRAYGNGSNGYAGVWVRIS